MNRDLGLSMLETIKRLIKDRYYDKNYRGIDLDKHFEAAKARVKTLQTIAGIMRAVAQVLIDFGDSHTRFIPPPRDNRVEYGFTMQMIGNNCFVTDVNADSDAAKQGLKVGDRIKSIDGMPIDRGSLWVAEYLLYALDPRPKVALQAVGADGRERMLNVSSTFKTRLQRENERWASRKRKRANPYRCSPIDPSVIVCKLQTFSVEKKMIDAMMEEATKFPNLILDLRGNGGGYVHIEEYLSGHFFDREVKIGDVVTRGAKIRAVVAKPAPSRRFGGELIVLTDSDSASASEVFARTIQIEKRGKVVGDVTAGAVMTSLAFTASNRRGFSSWVIHYGVSVSIEDWIMSDGGRLENVGVIPDYAVGPTAFSLAERYDPVLAFAAKLMGVKITSKDAGKLNFLHKKGEDEKKEAEEDEGTETEGAN